MADTRCARRTLSGMLFTLLAAVADRAAAATYKVSPSGSLTLGSALASAVAGDTISLADGTYYEAIVSVRDGKSSSPITIKGSSKSVIRGSWSSRSVHITHNYISLKGFTVQGMTGSKKSDADSYVHKCVYVQGNGRKDPLKGFIMESLTIKNCGGECVRLINFVKGAELNYNTISDCGIHDYTFGWGSGNGEGIYIGTWASQWDDDDEGDDTSGNLIKRNTITTNAAECVDIKEGSTDNVVEYNTCRNQLDSNAACYSVRGSGNTLRYNEATDCAGAGIRLGGDVVGSEAYGVDNDVYKNTFDDVGYEAIWNTRTPQGDVCGNSCDDSGCTVIGTYWQDIVDTWDQSC